MRASRPRNACTSPKDLSTPSITTAVFPSWRAVAAGGVATTSMSARAVDDFDGDRHALAQAAVELVGVDHHAQPIDQVGAQLGRLHRLRRELDRKSTRLNSSH